MPDLNPFDDPLRRIRSVYADLSSRKDVLGKELNWFDSTNRGDLNARLAETRQQTQLLRNQLQESANRIISHQCVHEKLKTQVRTLFNPKNWFDPDQIQLRQQQNEVVLAIQAELAESNRLTGEVENTVRSVAEQEKIIARYSAFDANARREDLRNIESQLATELLRGQRILVRKQAVDKALQPVVEQLRDYEQLKQRAESNKVRAAALDRAISNASNSYEKAMAHKQCESEFEVGSPTKVIERSDREIVRINRDYEKAYRRAVEIGQKASRTIDTVIIDGNNLCYDSQKFIGLGALKSVISFLHPVYSVTIVFDAAIRSMLQVYDQAIGKALGDGVTVHIVSTGSKADETILNLAGTDKNAYILSNDRFGEYNDKSAVREKRILRHEIVNGRVFVNDLNFEGTYSGP